jgi:taurine dioxygenase
MAIETVALSPALGVEVSGVDLHGDLAAVGDDLRALLAAHHLLRFRVPELTADEQLRLLGRFGPTLDESRDGSGWTNVSNVEEGGVLGDGEFLFHSDLEFTDDPVRVLSLYAVELPEEPTSTRFASTVRAAARLDAATRDRLEGRTAIHVYPLLEARGDQRYRLTEVDERAARAEHPVLMRHPATGAELLYTSAMQTDSIVGVPEDESEALLARCWELLYVPDNVYEHVWQPGDLLVWDNLALQHARSAVSGRRTLRRVPVGNVLARLRTEP